MRMRQNRFKYKPEHVDCTLCTKWRTRPKGCSVPSCPWLAERIEAGVVSYRDAVMALFQHWPMLLPRVKVLASLSAQLWADTHHAARMEGLKAVVGYSPIATTPQYYAAEYLLSSNRSILAHTRRCFDRRGIDFSYAERSKLSIHEYTLLKAAESLYCNTDGLTGNDLADPDVVGREAFQLIVNALLIANYGLAALKLKSYKDGDWE